MGDRNDRIDVASCACGVLLAGGAAAVGVGIFQSPVLLISYCVILVVSFCVMGNFGVVFRGRLFGGAPWGEISRGLLQEFSGFRASFSSILVSLSF